MMTVVIGCVLFGVLLALWEFRDKKL